MKRFLLISFLFLSNIICVYAAMGPTITQKGKWIALNSFQIVQAEIDGKSVRVCLPSLTFNSDVDKEKLFGELAENIEGQDAVFNLYHDGLGRPKKVGGMFYASDVFLKKLDRTYTGYLNELGYKCKASKKPAYEEDNFDEIAGVSYSKKPKKEEKGEVKKKKKKKKKMVEEWLEKQPKRHIETIYDVLPPGVVHPSTRKFAAEVNAKIEAMRGRPFKMEGDVEVDPVRWAKGTFGILQENGIINGAVIEGKKPVLKIRVPAEKGWLKPEMVNELNGAKCEFMIQRLKNGREAFEDGAFIIRDIYLYQAKLSWEELMEKWKVKCPEFSKEEKYAEQPIVINSDYVSGTWVKTISPVLCMVKFEGKVGYGEKELIRVMPPENKPQDFKNFIKEFDAKYAGKPVGVTVLTFQDNKPYVELGQKRAIKIYFPDEQKDLTTLITEVANK